MFTGIVQHRGVVAHSQAVDSGRILRIDATGWSHRPGLGESVCVSGVCLTTAGDWRDTASADRLVLQFDVVGATLSRTTLEDLRPGDAVNIESSATPATLLGGHLVQGHIDGVGVIERITRAPAEVRHTIRPPADMVNWLVPQGSICVDGVSLTLAEVGRDTFEVALIPTTLEATTLGLAREGQRVNLEADMIAKTVAHVLRRYRDESRR